MSEGVVSPVDVEKLRRDIAERDALIEALRALNASLEGKTATLESVLINHAIEIELLKRKLFGAKSERTGTTELQLSLGTILADAEALQKKLDELKAKDDGGAADGAGAGGSSNGAKDRPKPKGRRDLSAST